MRLNTLLCTTALVAVAATGASAQGSDWSLSKAAEP